MRIDAIVEALRNDLLALGGLGDERLAEAAGRLTAALSGAVTMRLLDALAQASAELSAQIPEGRVEVRLAGTDPELVFVPEVPEPAAPGVDDELSARITLRLSEPLKARIEEAAAREGVSVNAWLNRALARSVDADRSERGRRIGKRLTGFAES